MKKNNVNRGLGLLLSVLAGFSAGAFATGETFLGTGAGSSDGAGNNNTAVGYQALQENISGGSNTALGARAAESYQGASSTGDAENVFIGAEACYGNTPDGGVSWTTRCDVDDSVFIGYRAGFLATTALDMVVIGERAGYNLTNANDGVFVGHEAGYSNTTGYDNTFIGEYAGQQNIGGDDNTFIGHYAGRYNTEGGDNTYVGTEAGYGSSGNTTGDENTALGYQALRTITTGENNTAVGYQAGYDNATASWNTSVGTYALTDTGAGLGNVGLGGGAGARIEHADFNVFIGLGAGARTNVSNGTSNASRNNGIGLWAGFGNEEGSDNVWLGTRAGTTRALGSYNHSVEETQVASNCDGNCSGIYGPYPAGGDGTSGIDVDGVNNTTVIGNFAGAGFHDSVVVGYNAWSRDRDSVVIGANASAYTPDNIVIGHTAVANSLANQSITIGNDAAVNHTNSINIGYGVISHGNNTVTMGNGTTASWDPAADTATTLGTDSYRFANVFSNKLSVDAATLGAAEIDLFADSGASDNDRWTIAAANGGDFSISSFASGADVDLLTLDNTGNATLAGDLTLNSDQRLKKDIQPIDKPLEKVMAIEGKTYYWKDSKARDDKKHYGVIAQNVEAHLPELVDTDKQGMKTVNYQGLIPVLLGAMQEQQAQIETLQNQLLEMQETVEQQDRIISSLEQ